MKKERQALLPNLAIGVCAALLAGAVALGAVRSYGPAFFLKAEAPAKLKVDAPLAKAWLRAVEKNEAGRAALTASRIVPENDEFAMPDQELLAAISEFGVRLGFLTDPFNKADFARWRDLVEARRVAKSLNDSIPSIFKALMERVKPFAPETTPAPPPLTPMEAWNSGRGSNDDRLRLLCDLAWQAGASAKIVWPLKDRAPLGAFCLIEREGRRWTADCANGILLEGPFPPPAEALASLENAWGKDVVETLKRGGPFVYLAPCEALDFRRADIRLYRRLAKTGVAGLPRAPRKASASLAEAKKAAGDKGLAYFWQHPFLGLASFKEAAPLWLLSADPMKGATQAQDLD